MKQAFYQVLWASIEDHPALWEIHWEINSLFPSESSEKNKWLAEHILSRLLEAGLIHCYIGSWGNEQLDVVDDQEAQELIHRAEYWVPVPIGSPCLKIGSTVRGEKFHLEELLPDSLFDELKS